MSPVSLNGVVLGGILDIVATNIAAIPLVVLAATRANVLSPGVHWGLSLCAPAPAIRSGYCSLTRRQGDSLVRS